MKIASPPLQPTGAHSPQLIVSARELETSFIAEVLKHMDVGEATAGVTGTYTASEFASFLRMEYAQEISARGGFGLAESFVKALSGQETGGVE